MKVILMQDVKSLGKKGEIVNVNDGYARNFILPKKLGVEANGKNLNDLKLKKQNEEKVAQENLDAAKELAAKLGEGKVELKIKTGEGGKTFGSVSSKEIAVAVKEQMGIDIDKKKIQLKESIKTLGMHLVPVKLHPKVTAEPAPITSPAPAPRAWATPPSATLTSGRRSVSTWTPSQRAAPRRSWASSSSCWPCSPPSPRPSPSPRPA